MTSTIQNVSSRKSSPAVLERRELQQQRQRHRLLVAAGATFARFGYADAVIGDIIKTAGMSRRSYYEHFTSKESILEALYKEAHQRIFVEYDELLRSAASRAPMVDASCLIQAFLNVVRTYGFVRDPATATTSQSVNQAYRALQKQLTDTLTDLVRQVNPDDERRVEHKSLRIRSFLHGLSGLAHDRMVFNLDDEAQLLSAHAAALLLAAPLFADDVSQS